MRDSYVKKCITPAAVPEILGFDIQSSAIISISTSVGIDLLRLVEMPVQWTRWGTPLSETRQTGLLSGQSNAWKGTPWAAESMHDLD